MGFPKDDYEKAIAELRATMLDRDAKGRNETNDFYSQFPHGVSDLTFELYRRVQRILGAEKKGDMETVYGDTLDLANYSVFLMMMLKAKTSSANPPFPPPLRDTVREFQAAPRPSQQPDSMVQGLCSANNGCLPDGCHQGLPLEGERPCTEDWYNPR